MADFQRGANVFKDTWIKNVKRLLREQDLTVAEAARLLGTSKQYLSTILSDSEPQSTKEQVAESLSLLLHTHPSRLYAPQSVPPDDAENAKLPALDIPSSALEQAVLAERYFLSGNYRRAYTLVAVLIEQHQSELPLTALAQVRLLAGKCACLLGESDTADNYLREALRVLQKRLATKPEKYLMLCLECLRYLALSAHLRQDYVRAMKAHRQSLQLARKYHTELSDVLPSWEALGQNVLRTATKQGRMSTIVEVSMELEQFALQVGSDGVRISAAVTREFALLAVAKATGQGIEGHCLPNIPEIRDPYVALQYAAMLYECQGDLTLLLAALPDGSENTGLKSVKSWVSYFLDSHVVRPAKPSDQELKTAVALLGFFLNQAGKVDKEGDELSIWQEALFELKNAKELPLYIYTLACGLDKFASDLGEHNCAVLRALLKKCVDAFVR